MALNCILITAAGMWPVVFAIVGPISLGLVVLELLFWSGLLGGGYIVWKRVATRRAQRRSGYGPVANSSAAALLLHR
jgi:hypothetical protein